MSLCPVINQCRVGPWMQLSPSMDAALSIFATISNHSSYTDSVLNTSLMYYIAPYHDIYIDYLIQSLQQPYEMATIIIPIQRRKVSLGEHTGLNSCPQNSHLRTSPVVQWFKIHLPVQGTQVQSLVQKDLTCCGAVKSIHHNC